MQSLEGNEGFMSIDPEHTDHETSVIQTEPKYNIFNNICNNIFT